MRKRGYELYEKLLTCITLLDTFCAMRKTDKKKFKMGKKDLKKRKHKKMIIKFKYHHFPKKKQYVNIFVQLHSVDLCTEYYKYSLNKNGFFW